MLLKDFINTIEYIQADVVSYVDENGNEFTCDKDDLTFLNAEVIYHHEAEHGHLEIVLELRGYLL